MTGRVALGGTPWEEGGRPGPVLVGGACGVKSDGLGGCCWAGAVGWYWPYGLKKNSTILKRLTQSYEPRERNLTKTIYSYNNLCFWCRSLSSCGRLSCGHRSSVEGVWRLRSSSSLSLSVKQSVPQHRNRRLWREQDRAKKTRVLISV